MTLRHDGHEFTDGEGLGLDECLGLGEVRPKPLREQGGVHPGQHILIKISRMHKVLPPGGLGEVRPKPHREQGRVHPGQHILIKISISIGR